MGSVGDAYDNAMCESFFATLECEFLARHRFKTQTEVRNATFAFIDAAGIAEDRKGWLFRTSPRHTATVLTDQPMAQADAWRMIRRRAVAAGIHAPIGNHTFRATGITAYLGNGGALEHAQSMAAHESPRTTKLYDRTEERLTQDEVERIRLVSDEASTIAGAIPRSDICHRSTTSADITRWRSPGLGRQVAQLRATVDHPVG